MEVISLILPVIFGVLLMFLVFCIVAPIKDKKPKSKVHFYVARDKNKLLWLYLGKPERRQEAFVNSYGTYGGCMINQYHFKDFGLNENDFDNLKWEDEPVEVFLNTK